MFFGCAIPNANTDFPTWDTMWERECANKKVFTSSYVGLIYGARRLPQIGVPDETLAGVFESNHETLPGVNAFLNHKKGNYRFYTSLEVIEPDKIVTFSSGVNAMYSLYIENVFYFQILSRVFELDDTSPPFVVTAEYGGSIFGVNHPNIPTFHVIVKKSFQHHAVGVRYLKMLWSLNGIINAIGIIQI